MTGADARTLVVMQPTFLPWLGYFALIAEADEFVFLDDVQFSRQSWQSRNRLWGPNGEVLLSLPVARKPSKPPIREAKVVEGPDTAKLLSRVEGCLGAAPHWPLVSGLLDTGLARIPLGLAETNIGLIRDICRALGLTTAFHRSGEMALGPTDRASRLPGLCGALDAGVYLSPVGALEYLREDRPFDGTGIELRFQNFSHPVYRQRDAGFQSHLSVLDALAWLGPEATRAAILGGIGPPMTEAELVDRTNAD